jgi:hypothetical protein
MSLTKMTPEDWKAINEVNIIISSPFHPLVIISLSLSRGANPRFLKPGRLSWLVAHSVILSF